MANAPQLEGWALILGASSGFGGATAAEVARCGMDVFGVHLDRAQTLPLAEEVIGRIEGHGRKAVFFNINAVVRQHVFQQPYGDSSFEASDLEKPQVGPAHQVSQEFPPSSDVSAEPIEGKLKGCTHKRPTLSSVMEVLRRLGPTPVLPPQRANLATYDEIAEGRLGAGWQSLMRVRAGWTAVKGGL